MLDFDSNCRLTIDQVYERLMYINYNHTSTEEKFYPTHFPNRKTVEGEIQSIERHCLNFYPKESPADSHEYSLTDFLAGDNNTMDMDQNFSITQSFPSENETKIYFYKDSTLEKIRENNKDLTLKCGHTIDQSHFSGYVKTQFEIHENYDEILCEICKTPISHDLINQILNQRP